MDLEKFGKFIKELREAKGINQRQLAEALNVHRTSVVKWENGKALPLNDTLLILSEYFDVTVDELLAGERYKIEDKNKEISDDIKNETKNKVIFSLLSSRRKSRIIIMHFTMVTFILIVAFLIYYFFTTYNSIHVYMVYGESENYKLKDGVLIISKEATYLRFGNIYNMKDELIEIHNIKIYLDDKTDKYILFNGDPNEILFDKTTNIEIFNFRKLKYSYDDIYLSFNDENEEIIIKLKVEKDFENKGIIFNNKRAINYALDSEDIFVTINKVIFEKDNVDLSHTYIDGSKIEANANKYTWVWKKSCIKNRDKTFIKISEIIEKMNNEDLSFLGIKFETRTEYAIEYIEEILNEYKKQLNIDESTFVYGKGCRKSTYQRKYETLKEYKEKLIGYAKHIEICGEKRGSYSKTDNSATFMRIKRDYMGNDQLLPAYNMQVAVCDEYIATVDVKQYASDMDCFIPLMEKFKLQYGKYPKYPVADAGYGSYNNYP